MKNDSYSRLYARDTEDVPLLSFSHLVTDHAYNENTFQFHHVLFRALLARELLLLFCPATFFMLYV